MYASRASRWASSKLNFRSRLWPLLRFRALLVPAIRRSGESLDLAAAGLDLGSGRRGVRRVRTPNGLPVNSPKRTVGSRCANMYVARDRDCVYGDVFIHRLRAMGIRDRPVALRSPCQNGCAERLIGSIRWDCLDHVVEFGEGRLRHMLASCQRCYNDACTHLSLNKDAGKYGVTFVGRLRQTPRCHFLSRSRPLHPLGALRAFVRSIPSTGDKVA